jgi:uncharacterized protein
MTVTCRGRIVCERCAVADTPIARLRGLIGHDRLQPGQGLLIRPAAAIHTCLMRFAIDVLFLDADLRVVRIVPGLKPWRAACARRARAVLELAAGECERRNLRVSDQLVAHRTGAADIRIECFAAFSLSRPPRSR